MVGFSAKGGNIEKGSILKETKVIEKAKEVMGLFIREIEKKKQLIVYRARKKPTRG